MASHLPLLATLALLFIAVAAAGQEGNKIMKPFNPSCSTTDNYTDGSQYKRNLYKLLAALPAAADDKGWSYKGSTGAGSGPNAVFGLIMCVAGSNTAQCHDCLSRAPVGITTVCPGSWNVSAMYDACVLQYSSVPIPFRYLSAPIPATAELGDVFDRY